MLELIDLFPKTVAVAQLQSLTPEIIARAIDFIDLSGRTDLGADGAYTTEQQLLDKALFRDVRREILGLCLEYSKAYAHEVKELVLCNSWGNVVGRQESIRYHRHDNSYISGTFYLSGGSPLNILNPHQGGLFGLVPRVDPAAREENYRTWDSFNIPPKPGRLVLFPSGLQHGVLPSQNPEKRYSIAFNAIPVGRIGIPTSLLEIQRP